MKKENSDINSHLIKIGGMQCSFCVESIRKAFNRIDGVIDIAINLSHEEALIQYSQKRVSTTDLDNTMRKMGYAVRDPNKIRTYEDEQLELNQEKRLLIKAVIITLIALVFMLLKRTDYDQSWFKWVMLSLTLIMIFGIGLSILKMAIASISRGILNQHVLMEFGAFGGLIGGIIGFFISPWPMADFMGAAIFITTYHILSGYVSLMVRTKSSRAILNLMDLQPPTARVIRNNEEKRIPIADIKINDLVIIKPGENIPVDGTIIVGNSYVDQSLVTGEPIPVLKQIGDKVIGGSINQFGSLQVKVEKIGEDTFLQQIVRSVQEARALKPGILQYVEHVLKYFVPGVLLAASVTFILWIFIPWMTIGEPNVRRAIFATLAVLVMGYPCALGMATPLALIRGGGKAAEKGILMRSGEAFQIFKYVKIIALDKTGTITEGRPKIVKIITLDGSDENNLISLSASVEKESEHPIGKAIVEYAEENNIKLSKIKNFYSETGKGVSAYIDNRKILIGNPRYILNNNINPKNIEERIESMENQGWTVILTALENKLIGMIAIADTIKEDARYAVDNMKAAGIEPVLITGDNIKAAKFIASQVGISKVIAEVLPHEKAEYIRELQEKNKVVMVGDGINDSPALMQADIGIAFNTGTDIAIESADIILINNTISSVMDAYHISKSSFRKTQQNVIFAFLFNGIGIPLAMTGLIYPVYAMIAMVASVSTVLLNSYGGKLIPKYKFNSKTMELTRGNKYDIKYDIPTINCQSCINGLIATIEDVDQVVSIEGNTTDKNIIISLNGDVNLKNVENAITSIGHKVVKSEIIKEYHL